MSKKKIKYPAKYIVHCPTGPVYACEEHAGQVKGLMGFLGTHVAVQAADGDHECSNCVNENQ